MVLTQLPHLLSTPSPSASIGTGFARTLPTCFLNTFTRGVFLKHSMAMSSKIKLHVFPFVYFRIAAR